MKKYSLSVLILVLASFLLFTACEKEENQTVADPLQNIDTVQKDGTLYFEWLYEYNPQKPIVIIFHGEEDAENFFSVNLSKEIYTQDVLGTNFGYRGKKLLTDATNQNYDIAYYWWKYAGYNVAVFHWERFADDDFQTLVGKIYTTHKMRYLVNGEWKTDVLTSCLAQTVCSLYLRELKSFSGIGGEIRFVGNGIGGVLAHAVTLYLTEKYPSEVKYYPYRLTLCDLPLTDDKIYFSFEVVSTSGTVSDLLQAGNQKIAQKNIAVEIVQTENTKENYPYENKSEKLSDGFFSDVAYLTLQECYSDIFGDYLDKKRVALDWYLYSVLGSDDLTVGYPVSEETLNTSQVYSEINWGKNHTRPILNNRALTNDESYYAGKTRGFNYGISAWTPTFYIRALRGMAFTQQKATDIAGTDVHGRNKYLYTPYVLEKFSSENYQVCLREYTLLCGFLYFDENGDNYMNDGIGQGLSGEMLMTVKIGETPILTNIPVRTSEDGFYSVLFIDEKSEDLGLKVTSNEAGKVVFSGLNCSEKEYAVTLTNIVNKGYTVYQKTAVSSYYTVQTAANNFNGADMTVYINSDSVHTVLVKNCLLEAER